MASDRWDALLNGSTWYVPAANLLAYRLNQDSPARPIPAADQTLWSIPQAEGGRFSGISVAKIVDASGSVTRSRATMEGMVSRSGQVRLAFTTSGGGTIIGIGQVRQVNGGPAMEMQMITGGGGAFTTHWAYMLPLSTGTVPPNPGTAHGEQRAYRSGCYRWLRDTRWSMRSGGMGRENNNGRVMITGYRNGYFWGEGVRGPAQRSFHVLGSVTPEGNLLFNAIGTGNFQLRISQGGLLRGPRRLASARLRAYSDASGQLKRPLTLTRISAASADRLTGLDSQSSAVRSAEQQDSLLRRCNQSSPKAQSKGIAGGQLSAATVEPSFMPLGDEPFGLLQSGSRLGGMAADTLSASRLGALTL